MKCHKTLILASLFAAVRIVVALPNGSADSDCDEGEEAAGSNGRRAKVDGYRGWTSFQWFKTNNESAKNDEIGDGEGVGSGEEEDGDSNLTEPDEPAVNSLDNSDAVEDVRLSLQSAARKAYRSANASNPTIFAFNRTGTSTPRTPQKARGCLTTTRMFLKIYELLKIWKRLNTVRGRVASKKANANVTEMAENEVVKKAPISKAIDPRNRVKAPSVSDGRSRTRSKPVIAPSELPAAIPAKRQPSSVRAFAPPKSQIPFLVSPFWTDTLQRPDAPPPSPRHDLGFRQRQRRPLNMQYNIPVPVYNYQY